MKEKFVIEREYGKMKEKKWKKNTNFWREIEIFVQVRIQKVVTETKRKNAQDWRMKTIVEISENE